MKALVAHGQDVLLTVRVQPKASRECVILGDEDTVRVALMAPPLEGKANKALVQFLARALKIPRRNITLERGEKSRDKVLRLRESNMRDIEAKLRALST